MEAVVLYRVELELMEDAAVLLAIVKNEVDNVGCRSADKTLEILVGDCEKYVLHSETIEIAWYETFFADSLDDGLVSDFADSAAQFKMLHLIFC